MIDRRPAVSFLPATAVLELTYRCNHQCIFCSCPWEDGSGSFNRQDELTADQWKAAISRLCDMGVSNIAFTGGEPLERRDLREIVSHAASCQTEHIKTVNGSLVSEVSPPHLYLLSNGRKVDDSVLQMCMDYGVQLSMSLPGLETFSMHTGFNGADGVLRAFAKAKASGLRTVANITVTKLNLYELDRVIDAALMAGAEQILLNRFLPGGRGLYYRHQLSLSTDELRQMLDVAEATLQTVGKFGSLGTEVPRCAAEPSHYKSLQVGTRCSAAIQFFVVGPSGFTRVCNHSPVNLNHIDDISGLKTNEYWSVFTQRRYLPSGCYDCYSRSECDGGCREAAHLVGGHTRAPDMLMLEVCGMT